MPGANTGVHRIDAGRALGLRTFGFAVASIILMMLSQRTSLLEPVRGSLMTLVYPLQSTMAFPGRFFSWFDDSSQSRAELALENARLKRERLLTDARLQQLGAVAAENDRLRAMLDARPRLGADVRVAQILEIDSNPFRHRVVINKGARDGAFTQQSVVDANGVVGQVVDVGPFDASVMLLSDPAHAIQVEVVRNGLRTVVFGAGDYERLEVRYLPNNADIEVGDILVTTSLGSQFPPGYPVGEVTGVTPQARQAFAQVTVKPIAALTRMREVLLLIPDESAESIDAR